MNFLSALAQLVAGLYGAHRVSSNIIQHADEWFKLSISLTGSAFVCFFGTLGVVGAGTFTGAIASGAHPWLAFGIALGSGFFASCLTTAAGISYLWKRSALTRNIPLLSPMKVEEQGMKEGFALIIPAPPEKK